MTIEKTISELLIILTQSPIIWVRAFGFRLAQMRRVYDNPKAKTMAVDGVSWYINPEYVMSKSRLHNLLVCLHEAKHVFSRHPERLRDCLPQHHDIVNEAADYAVNLGLVQAGCPYPMVPEALINYEYVDDRGKALNVERIIPLLLQQQQQQQEQESCDDDLEALEIMPIDDQDDDQDGDDGSTLQPSSQDDDSNEDSDNGTSDSSDSDPEPDTDGADSAGSDSASVQDSDNGPAENGGQLGADQQQPEIDTGECWPAPDDMDANDAAQQNIAAATLAQSAGSGTLPDWMQQDIHDAAQNSATDWLALLRDRFANVINHDDYSYRKINAEYALIGMIAPALYNDGIGKVVIAGDESSSMSDEELNRITEQTAAIIQEWQPQEVIIVRHTSKIVFTEYLGQGEEPTKRKKRAHGGTDFMPVIELAEREMADALIWVTDCYPCDNPRECEVPTIFLGTTGTSESAWKRYLNYGDYIAVD